MLTQVKNSINSNLDKTEHFVRFYDEDDLLLAEVGDFLATALLAGGTGIIIATPDHIRALRRRLSKSVKKSKSAPSLPGKLITFDAQDMLNQFMVNDWPDESCFNAFVGKIIKTACADGGKVHAFGEMVALLCAKGLFDAALGLERMWNDLAEETSFSLFCAYPWKQFPNAELSNVFQQVCKAHDHIGHNSATAASVNADDLVNTKNANLRLAELEQKARALEGEVARRIEAEKAVREHQEEFADFLENSAEGLHRVGIDGTILWSNKAELSMLGYRSEEYVGQHIASFHVDQAVIEDILTRLSSGETIYDYPARLRCKDGSIKHVLIHSNACFEEGKLRYTRCFTRDATDRHERDEAYTEREKLVAELTNANQAKDEFLAMLGHELRNPLAPITLVLDLMRMRNDDAHKKERRVIERQVEHMTRLVNDLLDISRITRGRMELKVSEIDVSQVLMKSVEMASPLFEQRNHELEVNIESGFHIQGDPIRVSQAVANLLNNAARYTEQGGHIVLSANRQSENWLHVSVKDDGAGLSEAMLDKIFEMFFQAKQNIDRAQGGLGIGLALVKNIIELHGGTVEAKSNGIGCGSEFILKLPLLALSVSPPETVEAESLTSNISKRRIMLVDDNLDALNTLGSMLQIGGNDVEIFDNPIAALSSVKRFQPEIAILDIGLPVMSGYELAVQMRSIMGSQSCRLIALTGYGQEADRAKSQAAGFEKHFVKPVSVDKIIDFINSPKKQLH